MGRPTVLGTCGIFKGYSRLSGNLFKPLFSNIWLHGNTGSTNAYKYLRTLQRTKAYTSVQTLCPLRNASFAIFAKDVPTIASNIFENMFFEYISQINF